MATPKQRWRVEVFVSLKPSIHDPPGRAVQYALVNHGYPGLIDVRIGKMIELVVEGPRSRAQIQKMLNKMCRDLLVNPVMEYSRYRIKRLKPSLTNAPATDVNI